MTNLEEGNSRTSLLSLERRWSTGGKGGRLLAECSRDVLTTALEGPNMAPWISIGHDEPAKRRGSPDRKGQTRVA